MASSPDTSDWQKRYALIEKVYCEGRWATVMEAGTLLLRELLEAGPEQEAMGLRHRTQLLMAHTLLHGYGDRDAAEDLYEVIRRSDAEPALRQMAEDGLDLCHQPLKSGRVLEEEEEGPVLERPELFLPEAERGIPEEESAAMAPPPPAAAAQMPLRPLIPRRSEPTEQAGADSPQLESAEPEQPIGTAGGVDLGIAADPFRPEEATTPAREPAGETPVMPWLTGPPQAPATEPLTSPLPWVEEPVLSPGVSSLPTASEALIPDVVEEPELMEVHQATPSLAEEVDLKIQPVVPPVDRASRISRPTEESTPEPEKDGELRSGLLLVVVG